MFHIFDYLQNKINFRFFNLTTPSLEPNNSKTAHDLVLWAFMCSQDVLWLFLLCAKVWEITWLYQPFCSGSALLGLWEVFVYVPMAKDRFRQLLKL